MFVRHRSFFSRCSALKRHIRNHPDRHVLDLDRCCPNAGSPPKGPLELVGTMNDSSKRLHDDQLPVAKRSVQKSLQRFPSDESPLGSGYVKEMLPSPFPDKPGDDISAMFPEGIQSLSQWGSTEIMFGKFKGKGMSYADLVASKSDDCLSYVKWIHSRRASATGELGDLAKYIVCAENVSKQHDPTMGGLIPGTNTRRVFKA